MDGDEVGQLSSKSAPSGSIPPPKVAYRYLAAKAYADDFFRTGHLRLTSLPILRTYADEHRGDPKEGSVDVSHEDAYGNSFRILTAIGHDILVLCTSTQLSRKLAKAFNAEACIRIFDVPKFAEAVSACVPNMISCFGGSCLYAESLAVNRKTSQNLGALMRSEDGSLSIANGLQMNYTSQMVTNEHLFRKQARFREQEEFRLAWRLRRNPAPHEDIICPDARSYCDHVDIPSE